MIPRVRRFFSSSHQRNSVIARKRELAGVLDYVWQQLDQNSDAAETILPEYSALTRPKRASQFGRHVKELLISARRRVFGEIGDVRLVPSEAAIYSSAIGGQIDALVEQAERGKTYVHWPMTMTKSDRKWWNKIRLNDLWIVVQFDGQDNPVEFGIHFVVGKHQIAAAAERVDCVVLCSLDEFETTENIEAEIATWGLEPHQFDGRRAPDRVRKFLVQKVARSSIMRTQQPQSSSDFE